MAKDIKDDERLAYAPAEAARLIGYSRSGFYLLLSSGEVPSFKLGRRRLITRQHLIEFLQRAAEPTGSSHECGESVS
jgi:excisionase family DNA binding protein